MYLQLQTTHVLPGKKIAKVRGGRDFASDALRVFSSLILDMADANMDQITARKITMAPEPWEDAVKNAKINENQPESADDGEDDDEDDDEDDEDEEDYDSDEELSDGDDLAVSDVVF
jgi:hypothetical protein